MRDGDKAASLPGGVDEGKVATVKTTIVGTRPIDLPPARASSRALRKAPFVFTSLVPAATAFSSRASRSAASRSASDTPAS